MKLSLKLVRILLPLSLANIVSLALPYSNASANTSTYTACYFEKEGHTTWHWGLDSRFNWYNLSGKWVQNHQTKNYKFETNTSESNILESCKSSQHYYQKLDYKFIGVYAADSGAGKNYPIYVNGKNISPEYF